MQLDDDKILAAAWVFEQARGRQLEQIEIEEIEQANLSNCDPDELANQLVACLQDGRSLTADLRCSAYWALGKRGDTALISFFRKALATEIERDPQVAYPVMVALDDLGEAVFDASREGNSIVEVDLNKRDAKAYLEAVNPE